MANRTNPVALADMEMGHLLLDWDAREYLEYYYRISTVPEDEAVLFRFLARGLSKIGRHFESAIELGCGPVIHHAACAIPWVDRLDMADLQESNLDELRCWLRGDPAAFDWSVYIAGEGGVLDAEGRTSTLAEREALLRSRVRLMSCDLRSPLPLGAPMRYPLVTTYHCAEWIDPTIAGWRQTMRNVTSLVEPNGWLFVVGVHVTDVCVVNGRRIPCANLLEADIRRALEDLGFDPATTHHEVWPGPSPQRDGVQGTFMAYAQRVR